MLIYGINVSEIEIYEIYLDNLEEMLKDYDSSLYEDFKGCVYLETVPPARERAYRTENWFHEYESQGCHGLGAFLHDIIKKKEGIDLAMNDNKGVNGFILGLSPDFPWNYSRKTKNLTDGKYCAIIEKWIKMFSTHKPTIQMWDCAGSGNSGDSDEGLDFDLPYM